MKKQTRKFKYRDKLFFFTYEYEPILNDYEAHIFIRHTVKPETAIKAFFSLDEITFNTKYNRYEGFSKTYDLEVHYFYLDENKSKVFIITAAAPR